MDKTQIAKLKASWRELIDNKRVPGGLEKLSVLIGKSPSYLRNHLNNSSVPGVDVIMGLSEHLKIPPNELLNYHPSKLHHESNLDAMQIADSIAQEVWGIVVNKLTQGTDRPTGRDLMLWWKSNNGRLEASDAFAECFDLYYEPKGETREIRALSLGQRSLAAVSLGVHSPEVLRNTLAPLGTEFAHRILLSHSQSIQEGPISTLETLDVAHPNGLNRITIEYIRTLLPVTAPDGTSCVLNYSELLGKPGIMSGHIR
ncbi:hypothetical protein QEZ52_00440 [Aliisedimentitalea scapharcae]|uniref:HTH cro/C1-type domain-containing protein n=1 Tax=Aliisedimentitalea scapharcae TaxID=1524259 RepID=A0ABZ2XSZ5_9RHOB